jgi:hypothetical protein
MRGWRPLVQGDDHHRQDVFVGASFACPSEAESAVAHGHYSQYMWGSDYPHCEGTYQCLDDEYQTSNTRVALRHTFGHLPRPEVEQMIGLNAVDVYSLDRQALSDVAAKIGAPTWDELGRPLTPSEMPSDAGVLHNLAFRSHGVWD